MQLAQLLHIAGGVGLIDLHGLQTHGAVLHAAAAADAGVDRCGLCSGLAQQDQTGSGLGGGVGKVLHSGAHHGTAGNHLAQLALHAHIVQNILISSTHGHNNILGLCAGIAVHGDGTLDHRHTGSQILAQRGNTGHVHHDGTCIGGQTAVGHLAAEALLNEDQLCAGAVNTGQGLDFDGAVVLGLFAQQVDALGLVILNADDALRDAGILQHSLDAADDIIRGIKAVLQYTGIPKCIIGIENNKPECIDLLCKKTKDDSTIEVKPLPSVYGTGAELILIEKCLGREVPHGGLPADAGAIVMNVTSVSTLGKYLATGMPVVQRTITVDGDACAKPQNVVVPVGTAYQDILDYVGVKGELGKVVAGGAMMGPAVENLSYPTTKTTSGLILLSKAAAQPAPVNPCIRCGRCVEYCPMGLEPVEVNQAYAARDVQELGKLHADYCFNCGSCSFVCPAKRPVTQMMSLAKAFYLGEIKKGGNK